MRNGLVRRGNEAISMGRATSELSLKRRKLRLKCKSGAVSGIKGKDFLMTVLPIVYA